MKAKQTSKSPKARTERAKPRSVQRGVGRRPRYVYVVNYRYDYEGESTEAVYATRKLAEKHPWGGDGKEIYKMRVETKPPNEKGQR